MISSYTVSFSFEIASIGKNIGQYICFVSLSPLRRGPGVKKADFNHKFESSSKYKPWSKNGLEPRFPAHFCVTVGFRLWKRTKMARANFQSHLEKLSPNIQFAKRYDFADSRALSNILVYSISSSTSFVQLVWMYCSMLHLDMAWGDPSPPQNGP